jgi:5'-nucleotidase
MRILLTNDDGIYAPGLATLATALKRLGEVTVVAPALEQSGVGLSITYLHPILVRQEYRDGTFYGHAVQGSPADCVKLGMLEFCDPEPDLIVSGINSGSNVGINVLYSGTVAGAIEGAFFGKTSVAVSLAQGTPPDYDAAAAYATRVIETLLATNPAAGSLWNLNLPETRPGWPLGLKPVRMAVRRRYDVVEKRTDPRGRTYFWSGIEAIRNHEPEPETDLYEIGQGFATLTPLHFDLTNHDVVAKLGDVKWPG